MKSRELIPPTVDELLRYRTNTGCSLKEAKDILIRNQLIHLLGLPCTVTDLRLILLTAIKEGIL